MFLIPNFLKIITNKLKSKLGKNQYKSVIKLEVLENLLFLSSYTNIQQTHPELAVKLSLNINNWQEMLGERYTQTVSIEDMIVDGIADRVTLQFSKFISDNTKIIHLDNIVLNDLPKSFSIHTLALYFAGEGNIISSRDTFSYIHKNTLYKLLVSDQKAYIHMQKHSLKRH